jgi:L-asparaginase II
MTNPVLIELTRGALVESVHTGALAITRSNGEIVATIGDVHRPIFPRSAIKAFQALPLLESGAADAYGFGNREIALACASHSGTPEHADLAASMLARANLNASSLACGAHAPMHEDSAFALRQSGKQPTVLNNNCSGKHSGMVSTCAHCKDEVAGYLRLDHPHQIRIATALSEMTAAPVSAANAGIDGCSAPNWAIPLADLAQGFAKLVTGDGLQKFRATHARRIAAACMAEPNLVAGPGRLDTLAMTALKGRVFMKTGAEAVYCGGFPELGMGFALKIDDGNMRASEAVMEAILQRVFGPTAAFGRLGPIRNWHKSETGQIQCSTALARTLDTLTKSALT